MRGFRASLRDFTSIRGLQRDESLGYFSAAPSGLRWTVPRCEGETASGQLARRRRYAGLYFAPRARLFPKSFQHLAGDRTQQGAYDAYDDFWFVFGQPICHANFVGIAQVHNALRTDEVVDDRRRDDNASRKSGEF